MNKLKERLSKAVQKKKKVVKLGEVELLGAVNFAGKEMFPLSERNPAPEIDSEPENTQENSVPFELSFASRVSRRFKNRLFLWKSSEIEVWSAFDDSNESNVHINARSSTPYLVEEAERYTDLGNHSTIVKYIANFVENEMLHVVVEPMNAGPLSYYCGRTKEWPERAIAYVCHQILEALKFMHLHIQVHGQISSESILFNDRGKVKLRYHSLPYNLSQNDPEKDSQPKKTSKTDIWSLGLVALEMADGIAPDAEILAKEPVSAKTQASGLKDPSAWTEEFKLFLEVALGRSRLPNVDADMLLHHVFLKKLMCAEEFYAFLERVVLSRLPEKMLETTQKDLDMFNDFFDNKKTKLSVPEV